MVSSPLTTLTALHELLAIGPHIPQNAASKRGIAQVTDLPALGAGGMFQMPWEAHSSLPSPDDVCLCVPFSQPCDSSDSCSTCDSLRYLSAPLLPSHFPPPSMQNNPANQRKSSVLLLLFTLTFPLTQWISDVFVNQPLPSTTAMLQLLKRNTRESTSCLCEIPMQTI